MSAHKIIILLFFAFLWATDASAKEDMPCSTPQGIESGVIFRFESAKLGADNAAALFRIENRTDSAIQLRVQDVGDEKYFSGLTAGYEYPDINGVWVRHITSIGVEPEPRLYTIPPGAHSYFKYPLPSLEALKHSGGSTRLVISLSKPNLCLYSTTLHAKRKESRIEGITTF
jgi:hypothetical protein